MKKYQLKSIIVIVSLSIISKAYLYSQVSNNEKVITNEEKFEIISLISDKFEKIYLYPEVACKIRDSLNHNFSEGRYSKINMAGEFAAQIRNDIYSITNDKHVSVFYSPGFAKEMANSGENYYTREMINSFQELNFGFKELKILPGNIGYIDLRDFFPLKYAGETAVASMNFFSNCNALIIDLTKNGGGEEDMVQFLLSYLIDTGDSLSIFFSTTYSRYKDAYYQSYIFPYVPGRKIYKAPVFILTSRSTFSAAESFAYKLKTLKRATVIGENTRGGENPVEILSVNDEYILYIPAWRLLNSIGGTTIQWEGVGIKPDIEVESSEAFTTAYIQALNILIDSSKNDVKNQIYKWALEGIKLKAKPITCDSRTLLTLVGTYGQHVISFNNGNLYYQRGDRAKSRLIPVVEDFFLIEGIDDIRLKFIKEKNKVRELQVYYEDGQAFTYVR